MGWLALAACAALSACGSSPKSASTASAPTQTSGSAPRTAPTTTSTPTATTANPASGGTEASTTRTATEPAFASQPASGEGLAAAIATVRAHGFTPVNTSDYHPSHTLRVLIGRLTAAGDGYSQRAFFFVDGRYIGTDTSAPSATLRAVAQGDTEVTLAYPLYRQSDAMCCASAGAARVRFQLNNGKLVALDPIPPVNSGGGGEFAGEGRR